MGKTLAELERDLGIGELAMWIALNELDVEGRKNTAATAADDARKASKSLGRRF